MKTVKVVFVTEFCGWVSEKWEYLCVYHFFFVTLPRLCGALSQQEPYQNVSIKSCNTEQSYVADNHYLLQKHRAVS